MMDETIMAHWILFAFLALAVTWLAGVFGGMPGTQPRRSGEAPDAGDVKPALPREILDAVAGVTRRRSNATFGEVDYTPADARSDGD